ncbi:MAG: ABC transporter ATP-binding protein [Candidatus Solibacter usitatus]|nr:ABC transporter ATP-binding protein [Candidatus Solibacter usitatus]
MQATSISKSYATAGGAVPVLENISFTWNRGDAVSIMGPSGSGKSTLLYILGALEAPTSGSVTLDGENPFTMTEMAQAAFRNRHAGFLFQDHCLLPQCSVLENVLTPVLVDGPPDASALERAKLLLDQVGLSGRTHHRPGELSGGEKQRAAFARSLIRKPSVLLCDEPTGNLDRKSADAVADLLLGVHGEKETIVVIVTHSPDLAARFPSRFEMRDQSLHSRP